MVSFSPPKWTTRFAPPVANSQLGAFLQIPAPVLDKIPGPMGAQFLSSLGLGFGNLIERAQIFPVPALDENWSPKTLFLQTVVSTHLHSAATGGHWTGPTCPGSDKSTPQNVKNRSGLICDKFSASLC